MVAPVGAEACVLETESGTYFMLNALGAVIWSRVQAGQTLGEVHSSLGQQFAVAGDALWADLCSFVHTLLQQRLVTISSLGAG